MYQGLLRMMSHQSIHRTLQQERNQARLLALSKADWQA
jgi:hypothetical protein